GLELLQTLPDTPERTQQELLLLISLGPVYMATQGQGALAVERTYTRAQALCQQVEETPQLFPVLRGLWNFYLMRGALQIAHELAEQYLNLVQRIDEAQFLMEAHLRLGVTLMFRGAFTPALAHLEQGMALYNPQHASFLHAMQDPGVGCLGYAAWTLWSLGYPDQALTQSHEALTLTQHRSHPYSLTWSRFFTAVVHMLRREFHAVQELAEAIITSATAHEFRLWEAEGTFLRGRSLARQGQDKEGIVQMRQGLASLQATGATLGMTGR